MTLRLATNRRPLALNLRQITGVVRSILPYDAQGDAGPPRGWVIQGLGLAVACL